MSSLPVTSQISLTLEVSAMFFKRGNNLLNLLLKYMKVSCLAITNSHAYHVLSKDSGCIKTTCDMVFDETNGFQVEQYDLDVVDDEEASCKALQRMIIGDVRSQGPSEPQSPNDTTPPTQGHEQDQEYEQEEDEAHDQEEIIDQEGDKDDGDHKGSRTRPPHLRVHQTVQRDHPVHNILGDIKNGVTIRSHVADFYQHYSFVSSLEPFKVEDTLHVPVWWWPCKESITISSEIKYDLWLIDQR
jgi:hypothetical protein